MGDLASGQFVDATMYNADTFDVGDVKWSARRIPSNGWLLCDASAVSRSTYADLFAAIVPALGSFTVTIASPGVFTLNGHGLVIGDRVYLVTTGALPSGLAANVIYYVVSVPTSNTFALSASEGGSAINTTGSQSGVHTLHYCPWGLGDGSTTFNVPDLGGRPLVAASGASGNAKVRAQGQNEGNALANRAGLRHRHVASFPFHAPGGSTNGTNALVTDATVDGTNTTLVSVGSGVAADPLDGGCYAVMFCFIKHQSDQ